MCLLNLLLAFAKAAQRSCQMLLLRVATNPAGTPSPKSCVCNGIWGAQLPCYKILCRLHVALCFHIRRVWLKSLIWLSQIACCREAPVLLGHTWVQQALGSGAAQSPWNVFCVICHCTFCSSPLVSVVFDVIWVCPPGGSHKQATGVFDAIITLKNQGVLKNLGKVVRTYR